MSKYFNKITSAFLTLVLLITLSAPTALAADITPQQLFTYSENLEDGVTVFPNGDIYAKTGGTVKGFKQDGTSNGFSATLPTSYCGNLCSDEDGTLFAHSTNSSSIYIYEPLKSTVCKTLYSGVICQSLNVCGAYLYALQGETKSSTRVAVIKRVKISALKALANESDITWDKVYYPNYTAPSDTGNAYPAALAVDTAGNAYIVDKGSSNGYDASVNGIYKYNFKSGKVTAMKFVDAGNTLVGLTWLHAVNVDGFGNVAVVARNSNMIVLFRPGSVNADNFISVKGWCEDVASDSNGDLYYISYGNVNTGNCVCKCSLNNVSVTGLSISKTSKTLSVGETFTLSGTVTPSNATNKELIYSSSNTNVATVSDSGKVKAVSVGIAVITVKTAQGGIEKTCKVTVTKGANTLTAQGKTVTVKFAKLKKKNQTVKRAKAIDISNAQGALSFKKVKGSKKITVAKNGKITVKKGLKKGTYKITVKVTAAGNNIYDSATKTVTVTIKVK